MFICDPVEMNLNCLSFYDHFYVKIIHIIKTKFLFYVFFFSSYQYITSINYADP